jgi:hypothetical protein
VYALKEPGKLKEMVECRTHARKVHHELQTGFCVRKHDRIEIYQKSIGKSD